MEEVVGSFSPNMELPDGSQPFARFAEYADMIDSDPLLYSTVQCTHRQCPWVFGDDLGEYKDITVS